MSTSTTTIVRVPVFLFPLAQERLSKEELVAGVFRFWKKDGGRKKDRVGLSLPGAVSANNPPWSVYRTKSGQRFIVVLDKRMGPTFLMEEELESLALLHYGSRSPVAPPW